ncbi:Aste57867_1070 [Aphanomyces stellatus]|uniref:Aste57867_1070 protein n=1 Tax=Aphanomyces stellatus TaxID=120398 RepID=A0A485K5H8_9STRA|nr:hypothetical protein As57867_001069 [Aphanomyces stellatus]VFT78292.1 Aste57867_1070 [Aphanomyces stellatus]
MVFIMSQLALASALILVATTTKCVGGAATTPVTPIPTPIAFNMKPVRSIQARVQSLKPEWDAANEVWVSSQFPGLGPAFEDKWAASLDTVNTASVEGALFYVQTEGIAKGAGPACARKTNMSYVWFYDIVVANPYFATAEFGLDGGITPEYGTYVAMDNGRCTPLQEPNILPPACYQYAGLNTQPNLGPFVGGEPRAKHDKAVYEDNVWFSFPGNCFTTIFDQKKKNPACASVLKGGMCPRRVTPDGTKCTYSFQVMGYVSIDDVVGITNLTSSTTGKPYVDRTEFCRDGGIEFDFDNPKAGLPFWADPMNATANKGRSQKMMDLYTATVQGGKGDAKFFKSFPTVAELTDKNPKCWENSPLCAQAQFGCRRKLLAQVCEVCTAPSPDCKTKPPSEVGIPPLVKQYRPTPAPGATPSPVNVPGAAPVPGAPSSALSAWSLGMSALVLVAGLAIAS